MTVGVGRTCSFLAAGFWLGVKEAVMRGWRERAMEMKFLGAALPKNTTGNPRLYNGYL